MSMNSQIVSLCNQSIEKCHQILEGLDRIVNHYKASGMEAPQRVMDLITETHAQISDCQTIIQRVAS